LGEPFEIKVGYDIKVKNISDENQTVEVNRRAKSTGLPEKTGRVRPFTLKPGEERLLRKKYTYRGVYKKDKDLGRQIFVSRIGVLDHPHGGIKEAVFKVEK